MTVLSHKRAKKRPTCATPRSVKLRAHSNIRNNPLWPIIIRNQLQQVDPPSVRTRHRTDPRRIYPSGLISNRTKNLKVGNLYMTRSALGYSSRQSANSTQTSRYILQSRIIQIAENIMTISAPQNLLYVLMHLCDPFRSHFLFAFLWWHLCVRPKVYLVYRRSRWPRLPDLMTQTSTCWSRTIFRWTYCIAKIPHP